MAINRIVHLLTKQTGRLAALVVVLGFYAMARLPEVSNTERAELAGRFQFERFTLPDLPQYAHREVRNVSPQLQHISAWISAVGASVAMNDLDGDGLPNDVCWVDTRIDKVIVAPAPGTPSRYAPLVLEPVPLPYDTITMAPMGCLPLDANEDGSIDVIVYYWGRTPIAFLRYGSAYIPREVYPTAERWFTNAATSADADGDGHVDLIFGNYFPDGARILDPTSDDDEAMQRSMSRAFNGGRNRLLLWNQPQTGDDPGVFFVEAKDAFSDQVALAWTLAVGAADLDGDLLPEIYFANDFGPDRLLHNRSLPGRPAFALLEGEKLPWTPSSCRLGHDSFKGMGTDFGDVNGDGYLDIYVSNIATEFGLQESHFLWLSTGEIERMNDGIAPYMHGSEILGLARSGWGWDSRLDDFDNDGVLEAVQATGFLKGKINRWPELQALGTGNDEVLSNPRFWPRFVPGADVSGHEPNAFFARAADGRYYDIASEVGMSDPIVSRGIATADVDGDGDLDLAVANQWESSFFFRNDCPDCDNFLGLHLLLPLSSDYINQTTIVAGHPDSTVPGRAAIGASATVFLKDGRRLVAQVDGGNGHSGRRSSELHFGLGDTGPKETVKVALKWRDPQGEIHDETIEVAGGWYTVTLAWPGSRS